MPPPLATPDGPSHQTRRRPPTIPQREKEIQEQQERQQQQQQQEEEEAAHRRRPPASTKASKTPSHRLRTPAPNTLQETQTTRRSQLRRPPLDLGAPASLGQGRRSLPVVEVDAALSVSGAPQPAWGGCPAAACGGGWTQLYLCLGRLSRLWGNSSVRSQSTTLSGPGGLGATLSHSTGFKTKCIGHSQDQAASLLTSIPTSPQDRALHFLIKKKKKLAFEKSLSKREQALESCGI